MRALRQNIYLAIAGLMLAATVSAAANTGSDFEHKLRAAPAKVLLVDGSVATLKIERVWNGPVCRARLKNTGQEPVRIGRIDLFDLDHGLPEGTPIYGEGFQMLAQLGGTLEKPEDWGSYPDRTHYKLEEPEGLRTAHGLLLLHPADGSEILLGFASCRRFDGRISFDAKRLLISLDGEGCELAPGEIWELESFLAQIGAAREELLATLCAEIQKNHPRRAGFAVPPMGWCSWYCFGPKVTAENIARNIDWIAQHAPQLRYIQIDDGYQPWMGDWLESGKSFGGDTQSVLQQIRQRGFEPALWVAPLIASPESKLFAQHPDWFMRDQQGQPLRSDKVGFGGWRLGPWYALDGTHPEAERFLEQLFRTLRQQWGCTYFKLDASYWGALHDARLHDPKATRIEAYRRGMAAILRGAGDAFVLGCNQPMWASLGLLDGARTSMDISRSWKSIRQIGRQNLLRGWQNGRLWWNDPDCVLLSGSPEREDEAAAVSRNILPENEVLIHASAVHAIGGMLLSGDDLPAMAPQREWLLKKLLPPAGHAAGFADEQFTIGRTTLDGRELIYLFNWSDQPAKRQLQFEPHTRVSDFWTGEAVATQAGKFQTTLPARSARVLQALEAHANDSSKAAGPK